MWESAGECGLLSGIWIGQPICLYFNGFPLSSLKCSPSRSKCLFASFLSNFRETIHVWWSYMRESRHRVELQRKTTKELMTIDSCIDYRWHTHLQNSKGIHNLNVRTCAILTTLLLERRPMEGYLRIRGWSPNYALYCKVQAKTKPYFHHIV